MGGIWSPRAFGASWPVGARRSGALLIVTALCLASLMPGEVAGGEEPEPTTTTTLDPGSPTTTIDGSTSTTTSSTMPGETTTTTTGPPDSTTTTTDDPRPGAPTTTTSSTTSTTVPTLTELPEEEADLAHHLADLGGEDFRDQPPFDANVNRVVGEAAAAARGDVISAEARYESVLGRQAAAAARLAAVESRVEALGGASQAELAEARDAREVFEERAVEAYIRGSAPELEVLFGSETMGQMAARATLLEVVLEADDAATASYLDRRDALEDELASLLDEVTEAERGLARSEVEEEDLRASVARARVEAAVWQAGSQVVVEGFVFPVFGPNTFGDSFGASRMAGTEYAHWHEGTDINAATGTPLVAVEGGVIRQLSNHVLGGRGIDLTGDSGVEFYYAHLAAFAAGLRPGQRVEPGEVIGYVGTTGNAVGAHLHFEVHVDGRAVNPYPMLRVAWDWQAPFILEAAGQIELPTGIELPADGGFGATPPPLEGPGATLPPLLPGEPTTTASTTPPPTGPPTSGTPTSSPPTSPSTTRPD